jgi:uncharacterized protein YtpQ (UPF0354 family)
VAPADGLLAPTALASCYRIQIIRFLHRLFGRLTPESFAKDVQNALRSSGEHRNIRYDPGEFALRIGDNQRILYLHNSYEMYKATSKSSRKAAMRQIVRSWFSTEKPHPEEFADLGPDLLPVVRSRSYYDLTELRLRLSGGELKSLPYEILADHLAVGLVFDLPESMRSIPNEDLDRWQVSLYDALEKARQNLMEREHKVMQIGDGLYSSAAGDSYDASRMILLDLVRKLSVKGDFVAMVPNRDTLLITGSDDQAGLAIMSEYAKKALAQRPITGIAFRLDGEDWQPWLPPTGHSLFSTYQMLHLQSIAQDYAEQKALLDKLHEKSGSDLFVASYSAGERDGVIHTHCVWAKGVPTLLPKTDFVVCMKQQTAEGAMILPWSALVEVVGDLMKEEDIYPPRFRVESFPSDEQLKRLESRRVTLK